MNDAVLPATDDRVPRATRASVNDRIQARTLHDVSRFIGADPVFIDERISQLQREWDIERTLEAAAVAGFLLQHALQGWCPPLPLLRRLGLRTSAEIHDEIIALRILRGDFLDRVTYPEAALASARNWG